MFAVVIGVLVVSMLTLAVLRTMLIVRVHARHAELDPPDEGHRLQYRTKRLFQRLVFTPALTQGDKYRELRDLLTPIRVMYAVFGVSVVAALVLKVARDMGWMT